MENNPLVLERTYDAPVGKVWQALTDPEKMKQWYFDVPAFRPVVGTEFGFSAGGTCEDQFSHLCVVTKAVENQVIAYSWRYEGYPGMSEVSFELFPENGKTRLRLTHAGLETFVGDAFKKENFHKGWTHFTGALDTFLTGSAR